MQHSERTYLPIGDYGVIGNLHTVALVGLNGSVDFMCFPRFDSPSVFGALLDRKKGGFFEIAPVERDVDVKQMYLPDTAILMTRFMADAGVVEVLDFMPVKEQESRCVLIRRVTSVRGKLKLRMRCCPRFNYARSSHKAECDGRVLVLKSEGDDGIMVRLTSSVPIKIDEGDGYAEFTLHEMEKADFVMEAISKADVPKLELDHFVDKAFVATNEYWKNWISGSRYKGRWQEMVNRSAMTLKLLTSFQHGSMVAAATFALPETLGGERNWDYRYTWIRDSAFTMYIFIQLGFMDEAHRFIDWIKERFNDITEGGELQLMYGVDGHTNLKEEELNHLEGYRQSAPVRIGNAAYKQLQLDIYGELMDCLYLYNKYGGPITYDFWKKMEKQIDFVCEHWQEPDHGIWEVRHKKKKFLYSRLMAWVALDRAIKLVEDRSFPAPLDKWRTTRDAIYLEIFEDFYDPEQEAYVQSKNSDVLDASVLLMPIVRFVTPAEPRWHTTLKAVEQRLSSESLVYRYRLDDGATDGLDGEEGTFSMCSFWLVECLSKTGEFEKARLYFEKMLGYANHLGLYAEQLDTRGRQLGNYPQAFTHLGLISAALELNRQVENRPGATPA
ncbi:Glucoamylase (glucan-1,4-alpha-glucosidase), GH15 family [Catalinimonas alkaloidigena]|uniref:Glucoamylase (Glucan-1,4-alpha-glucosidase), GH15 family n=1 Tax=Catalinimonas alkaloidigena TaxID=1075417 RepID=A0A1G9EHL0_9BACT|nr:glycoside hydrolase family 15 protein [Catalinimonas alkaloidigena]SDK75616.1 Glucoamylase (glucan-1,4-alpha-glucosidase), GH15 family [Catalinimonas alkaloidigena]